VPLSEIPPEEQIPAFTLVATAYAFVWVALIGYVWSVARRLQKVETELATLSRERR
jgi:CcmD family protein